MPQGLTVYRTRVACSASAVKRLRGLVQGEAASQRVAAQLLCYKTLL
jgi:hypothetical protein